jgi:hypothetical protein
VLTRGGDVPFAGAVGRDAARSRGRCPRLWVIGGGEVYALCLPRAAALHLTHVDTDVAGPMRSSRPSTTPSGARPPALGILPTTAMPTPSLSSTTCLPMPDRCVAPGGSGRVDAAPGSPR